MEAMGFLHMCPENESSCLIVLYLHTTRTDEGRTQNGLLGIQDPNNYDQPSLLRDFQPCSGYSEQFQMVFNIIRDSLHRGK